jgi:apolipoprotein N-acyltransferase
MYLQTKNFIFSLFSTNKVEKSLFNRQFSIKIAISFLSGTLYALALPPYNLEVLAFISLVPLLFIIVNERTKKAALLGWVWGIGWAVFSFQFLREINPIVPYLLAPVLGLWPALFAFCIPFLYQNIVKKDSLDVKFANFGLFAIASAALFVLIEWTRSRLFVWNDFAITQWQNTNLIQIAKFTGSYGINFVVALGNLAVLSLIFRKKVKIFFLIFALIYLALFMLGDAIIKCRPTNNKTQKYF